MASSNIARLGVVLGLDTAEFTASIDKAINENKKLGQAIKRDTNAAAGEIISLKNATDDYGKTLTKVQLVEREIAQGRYRMATDDVKAQLMRQAAAYDAVAASAHKAAGGLTAWQKQGLMYQTTDFFTQIASGQSVMIAAIQQGGQLKDQMGGLGNMFRVLGPMILSPKGALVAFVAALIGGAAAAYSGRKEFDEFNNSIQLTGRYANFTYDEFKKMADGISTVSRGTIGGAKDILNSMVGSGQFTNKAFDSVSAAIQKFSDVSGLSAKDAAAKLIPSLDGTASSAKRLNDQYNFLTLAQYKHIEALDKQGKNQDAIILTADLLKQSLTDTTRELGNIDQLLDWGAKKWSTWWAAAKGWGVPETTQDQLKNIQNQIKNLGERPVAVAPGMIKNDMMGKQWDDELSFLKAKELSLKEIIKLDERSKADKLAGEKDKIKKYAAAGGVDTAAALNKQIEEAELETRKTYALMGSYAERDITIESESNIEKIRLDYKYKMMGKEKEFSGLLGKLRDADIAKEMASRASKLQDFHDKELAAIFTVRDAEAKAYEKWKQEDEERKLKVAMDHGDMFRNAKEAANLKRDELQFEKEMIGSSEKEIALKKLDLQLAKDLKMIEDSAIYTDEINLQNMRAMAEMKRIDAIQNIELADQIQRTKEVNEIVWNNMSNALENFVRNGKLSFKDLAGSIIKDLMLIELKANAMNLWKMVGGASGIMSSLFGGGVTPSGVSAGGSFRPSMGYANGGDPPVGVASMVGERGPELFVPRTAGTIIPNHALAGGMGGTTVNYNGPFIQSMSAIDTQSGIAFLAKNKQAVFASYQSANRSIPMSR